MTTETQNHYQFVPKPPFTVVGKVYNDSIDWTKNSTDPYSLSGRHTGITKSQTITDKARRPSLDSTFNTKL